MKQIEQILQHPLYQEYLHQLNIREEHRIYCKHDLAHFLDTARLAYINALENNLPYAREIIYAAALMHDLGRAIDNAQHDEYSAALAQKILPECGFTQAEVTLITDAIRKHRHEPSGDTLADILYIADKKSRNCFACPAQASCKWPLSKRTQTIWR